MALEVIGAGFGRTGTLSLKAALERLGYVKTHHMLEVLPSKKQSLLWLDVAKGNPPQWDEIFDGYAACVDHPASSYYEEIMQHYPNAKIVLSVRDADTWYKSASSTIYALPKAIPAWAKFLIPRMRRTLDMGNGTVWEKLFHGRFGDENYAKKIFLEHIEQVKTKVPSEKLLVFEVKQGWEPLCAFLGCDVPDEPFPHLNDAANFKKALRLLKFASFAPLFIGLIILGSIAYSVL
jgi:hypothetical protein